MFKFIIPFIIVNILQIQSVGAEEGFTELVLSAPVGATTYSISALEAELSKVFEDLEAAEQDLIQRKTDVENLEFDAVSYLNRLREKLEKLTPEQREKLLNADTQVDLNLPEYQKINRLIQEGNQRVGGFFKALDSHIQRVLDLTMTYSLISLSKYLKDVSLSPSETKKVQNHLQRLQKLRDRYLANKDQYGQGKDTLRTTPYYAFFVKLKEVYAELESFSPEKRWSKNRGKARLRRLNIFKTLIKIPGFSRLGLKGIKLFKAIILPRESTKESTSFNLALNSLMQEIASFKNIPVKVEGSEHLPATYDSNTINIYAASHRNALYDQLGLAHMGVENMVFFGAVNNFVPNFLNKIFKLKDKLIGLMNKNPGFIVVGKGASKGPIEQALEILETTPTRSFLIFPGGRLPEGLGATMGVREKFASDDGLLAEFEKAGYKINLVPVSMRHNATLFDETTPLTEVNHLSVRVGQNIPDDVRRLLLKVGGGEALGNLLRYALIDDLTTNKRLLWGQIRVSGLKENLNSYLFNEDRVYSCGNILKGY